jgi:3-hydroxyacyl-CoA dehydrogenase
MNYTEKLQNVSVLGAAGKMGSGILLLTCVEMADLSLLPENKGKTFVLNAIDVSAEGLSGLMKYLKVQVRKIAEKKAVMLRTLYADRKDLIENYDIIDEYIFDVINIVRPSTSIGVAYDSNIIFEAIKEDPALKVKIFSQIDKNNPHKPWYFTNTSSIPINNLDKQAELEGRIVGFHFYNPPAVQKLVELIKAENTLKEVEEFALEYAKKLRKIIVPSNDFAGFIGNGHFMRDALHGISEAQKLAKDSSLAEGIFMINRVSQDFLVRPMGIFQLIDYVGIDVCQYIMSVMNPYLKDEDLHSPLLDKMIELGVKGGQNSDGSQKDGFLKYDKGRPVAIYDAEKQTYVNISDIGPKCDEKLGFLPQTSIPWKATMGMPPAVKDQALARHFNGISEMKTLGSDLAKAYAARSKEIGLKLVADKVANSIQDVNIVKLTGFFHAYGPINDYLK